MWPTARYLIARHSRIDQFVAEPTEPLENRVDDHPGETRIEGYRDAVRLQFPKNIRCSFYGSHPGSLTIVRQHQRLEAFMDPDHVRVARIGLHRADSRHQLVNRDRLRLAHDLVDFISAH